jgi:hypothetical protein
LEYFYTNWEDFKPNLWATKNIHPQITTRKLENILWQCTGTKYDLPVKVNSPEAVIQDKYSRIYINKEFERKYFYLLDQT